MKVPDGSWLRLQLACGACWLALCAAVPVQRVEAAPSTPLAEWQRKNVLVEFRNLPKRYSCNELWYKFRDVLLRMGSLPNMTILTTRCEPALADDAARSPRVEVDFYMPRLLDGAAAGAADISVASRQIRFGPGQPPSLDSADCELLRQMKGALPGKVVTSHLSCRSSSSTHSAFSLVVQALLPDPPLHASVTPAKQ